MEKEKGIVKILIMTASYFSYLVGGWNKTIEAMFIFMVSDYATGYIKSLLGNKLSSKTGFRGLIKKCSYLFMVLIGAALDRVLLENNLNIPITILDFPVSFKVMMICSVIGTEGISIAENLAEIKIRVPYLMMRLLKRFCECEAYKKSNEEKKEP